MAKYCEEIIVKIESMLSIGVSNKSCAEAVGIPETTFYAWMKKPKFSQRVKKAKALGQVKSLKCIESDSSWQSKAWMLERIWPKEFGKKILEVSGPDGGPIETANRNLEITKDMDPKEAAQLYAEMIRGEG